MLKLVFDIETDDLKATKLWCIVAQDLDSNKIYRFAPHQLESGLELLKSANVLLGHNIIGFDIPVIKKLTGVDLSNKKVIDTLVLSRLFNPVREGGHSLEMWGYKLNYNKIEFEDYSHYSEEMMDYCVRDVKLNTQVYHRLIQQESAGFSKESARLEQGVSLILKEQEQDGFEFNQTKAESLLASLYERMNEVEEEVHETFKPKVMKEKLTPIILKSGKLSLMAYNEATKKRTNPSDEEIEKLFSGASSVIRTYEIPFNLGSRKQIGEY